MQYRFLPGALTAITCLLFFGVSAQNSSPYWSLTGNSNASASSKLGTTNGINLRLFTNNAERLTILSSNGYVGIGTTAPTSRFTINTATGSSPLRASIAGSTKLYMSSGGGLSVGSGSSAPANGLYVAGNVGIGTTAPSYKLHVAGTVHGASSTGNGVYGYSNYASGYGVYGESAYAGVYGTSNAYGVFGTAVQIGVYGQGGTYGILARATTPTGYGLYGDGGSYGVYGSGNTYGVYGHSGMYYGVYGFTGGGGSGASGVYANNDSYGYGVAAICRYGTGVFAKGGTYAGYFAGNVYSTGSYVSSDGKLKQNITELGSALELITKLQPRQYEFRQDGNFKLMNLPEGKHYGLIAQDLEQVLPALVKETEFDPNILNVPDSSGKRLNDTSASEKITFKAVNYTELIPILVKGMQEQEANNKALRVELEALRTANMRLEERLNKLEVALNNTNNNLPSTSAYLEQNSPNPTGGATSIRYYIPESATSANLTLTNAKGQVVKTVSLNNRGRGQVNLNTQGLASGTYHYTLYVDGKQTATKWLVIAK